MKAEKEDCQHKRVFGRVTEDNMMQRVCSDCGKELNKVPIKSSGVAL